MNNKSRIEGPIGALDVPAATASPSGPVRYVTWRIFLIGGSRADNDNRYADDDTPHEEPLHQIMGGTTYIADDDDLALFVDMFDIDEAKVVSRPMPALGYDFYVWRLEVDTDPGRVSKDLFRRNAQRC